MISTWQHAIKIECIPLIFVAFFLMGPKPLPKSCPGTQTDPYSGLYRIEPMRLERNDIGQRLVGRTRVIGYHWIRLFTIRRTGV